MVVKVEFHKANIKSGSRSLQSIHPAARPPLPSRTVPCREGMIRDLYCTVVLIHQYFGIIRVGSWLAGTGPGREEEGEEGGYVDT